MLTLLTVRFIEILKVVLMSDKDDKNGSGIKGVIEATTGLVKAVPVYEDAIQPAAKEAGKSLETVAKAVNTLLMPLRGVVWGAQQFESFIETRLSKKLESTPPEDVVAPDLKVVGPAFESLRYTNEDDDGLQDTYANLIADAMDRKSKGLVHPSFVEILKQFSSIDLEISRIVLSRQALAAIAIICRNKDKQEEYIVVDLVTLIKLNDAVISHKDVQVSIENLERLGLIEVQSGVRIADDSMYTPFDDLDIVKESKALILKEGKGSYKQQYSRIISTELGRRFHKVCLVSNK